MRANVISWGTLMTWEYPARFHSLAFLQVEGRYILRPPEVIGFRRVEGYVIHVKRFSRNRRVEGPAEKQASGVSRVIRSTREFLMVFFGDSGDDRKPIALHSLAFLQVGRRYMQ
jgi:hypothetical protein